MNKDHWDNSSRDSSPYNRSRSDALKMPNSKPSSLGISVTEMAIAPCTTRALSSNVHKHESLKSVVVNPEGVLEPAFAAPPFYILYSLPISIPS